MGKRFNGKFNKENIGISSELMKRYSGPLLIRGTQIKTKIRYDHKPIRMTKILKV